MARALILYDDDCGLCQWLLAWFLRWDRAHNLEPIALQSSEADALLADLEPEQRMASWHLVSGGERRSAGAAVPPLLRLLPGGGVLAALTARAPKLTERGYRWVAGHRSALGQLVPDRAKQRAAKRVRAHAAL